jgi:hypothetical protein
MVPTRWRPLASRKRVMPRLCRPIRRAEADRTTCSFSYRQMASLAVPTIPIFGTQIGSFPRFCYLRALGRRATLSQALVSSRCSRMSKICCGLIYSAGLTLDSPEPSGRYWCIQAGVLLAFSL